MTKYVEDHALGRSQYRKNKIKQILDEEQKRSNQIDVRNIKTT